MHMEGKRYKMRRNGETIKEKEKADTGGCAV
jgi:hypothetical protein